uniref:Uncharacterized protein n=1 Tax=Anguilla anguilla TaxID=7936 RepID=A0A0E9S9C8_ANGAN
MYSTEVLRDEMRSTCSPPCICPQSALACVFQVSTGSWAIRRPKH